MMVNNFGYDLPKAMHPEFGAFVKDDCDKLDESFIRRN